jgi:hypothetical protein
LIRRGQWSGDGGLRLLGHGEGSLPVNQHSYNVGQKSAAAPTAGACPRRRHTPVMRPGAVQVERPLCGGHFRLPSDRFWPAAAG